MPRKRAAAAKPSSPPRSWPAERVKLVPVDDLVPYAQNARMHTNDQVGRIAEAISKFGFTNAVIVDHRGEIIAGHGRVMAARRLGLKEVPAVEILEGEWSDADKAAYRIWDNQSALLSEWNPEMLRVSLVELKRLDYPLRLTGFEDKALVTFMANPNPKPPEGGFRAFGSDLATEHSCPKCGYRWSGNADAAPRPKA